MPQTPHTFFLGQKWERDARSISFFWRVLCMEIASLPFFPLRTSFQLLQFWIWLMLKAAAIQLVLSYRVILLPEAISQWQESHLPLCWPEPVHLPSWLFALLSIEFFGVGFFFFFFSPLSHCHLACPSLASLPGSSAGCVYEHWHVLWDLDKNGDSLCSLQNAWSLLSCRVGCCTRYHLDGSCLHLHWTLGEPRDCSDTQAS